MCDDFWCDTSYSWPICEQSIPSTTLGMSLSNLSKHVWPSDEQTWPLIEQCVLVIEQIRPSAEQLTRDDENLLSFSA